MPRGLSLRLVKLVKVRKMKEAMFKNAKGVVTKVSTVVLYLKLEMPLRMF